MSSKYEWKELAEIQAASAERAWNRVRELEAALNPNENEILTEIDRITVRIPSIGGAGAYFRSGIRWLRKRASETGADGTQEEKSL